MKLNTLYGKAKTGKIKEWDIRVRKMGDGTCYIEVEHGYQDGKKQLDSRYVGEGKNLGKSNETTPYEQACSEAQSSWKSQIDSGYAESESEISDTNSGMFLPMLAQSYDKHSKKIKYPAFVQPKFDGMRMLAKKENGIITVWSRTGKAIETMEHIQNELSGFLNEGECTDGELYVHGWNFQRLISAVKKIRTDTVEVCYHIYDTPSSGDFKVRFVDGISKRVAPAHIKFASTFSVKDEAELRKYESGFIQDSYEGAMVRNAASKYEFKNRSYDLQKVKAFKDAEFVIIGSKDGEGREEGCIIFRCLSGSGNPFDVRPRGSHELRQEWWKNRDSFVGKNLTVRYFELSDDGTPRFPVGISVRDYE